MSQQVAILLFCGYIALFLLKEVRRREGRYHGLWFVVLWLILIGSRSLSTWMGGGIAEGRWAESYDEGSAMERWVYFFLIAGGLYTLSLRGVKWGEVMRENSWLAVLFIYWGLSVVWSDMPIVALKRWIKDMGNVVMVVVILTEMNPVEACKAVFMRCACVLVPLSVLMIRFIPELGRTYHSWTGEMMYTGVTTHKNSLGALVLVTGLFVVWDSIERMKRGSFRKDRVGLFFDLSLLVMIASLIYMAHSATALACIVVGLALLGFASLPRMRVRFRNIGGYAILALSLLFMLNVFFDLKKFVVVDLLGRDMSLTTRTEVWPMLLDSNESVLLGTGFNSFWSGERLDKIYAELGIIQAHNGYLETYLNGGMVSLLLLLAFVMSSWKRIKDEVVSGTSAAGINVAIFAVALMYNFTEASFNKMGLVWFAFLVSVMRYSRPCYSTAVEPAWKEYA